MTFDSKSNVTRLADKRRSPKDMVYSEATLKDLALSGLDAQDAIDLHLVELTVGDVDSLTNGQFRATGYKIPYFDIEGNEKTNYRIRFHAAQRNRKSNKTRKKQRYWQNFEGVDVYLAPTVDWLQILKSNNLIVYITEGEKKAAAACKNELMALALGGVDSFASKKAGVELHQVIRDMVKRRSVGIVYDADMRVKYPVERAGNRLAELSIRAGADEVAIIELDVGYDFDNYLLDHTVDEFANLPFTLYGIKQRLEHMRTDKKKNEIARVRLRKMRDLITTDMSTSGQFCFQLQGEKKMLFWFDQRIHQLYSLDDRTDRDTLSRMDELYGINGSESEWSWLYDGISNHCVSKGVRCEVHDLAHGDDKGIVYIFNGRDVFKIESDGWKRVPNGTDGVLFHNPRMQNVKVLKDFECDYDPNETPMALLAKGPRFIKSMHMTVFESRMLFELWMWSTLFPHLLPTKAFPLLVGPEGSHKTTSAREFLRTIYGRTADVSYLDPKRPDGLAAQLAIQHLVVIDNVDGRYPSLANMIAVACTGGNYVLRELFTTLKSRAVRLNSFICATSREPDVFRRGDIANRLIPLNVHGIGGKKRSERSIVKETMARRNEWWTYILETMPKMLRAVKRYERIQHTYRMADFADFCLAIGPVIGYEIKDVKKALDHADGERSVLSLEGSTLPTLLEQLLDKFTFIKNVTAEELFHKLNQPPPAEQCPYKTSGSLARALASQASALKNVGIKLTLNQDKHRKQRTYSLERVSP